jgi:hypothetical protein
MNVDKPHINCENVRGNEEKIFSNIENKNIIRNILDGVDGSSEILPINITNSNY